jgi:O-antigen ligase
MVSVTNYERIAWGISGARLVIQYPLGYGLIERSFRQRGNILWPGSCLSQSHSGWIDLALGIGIPGLILLLSAMLFNIKKLNQIKLMSKSSLASWRATLTWALICFLMIWCTTEISQKVFFEELIFFIALASGVQSRLLKKSFDDPR